ncbi:AI-2E family transporter [bacterium]|nr:AI-2E family transporter [bacterium]
MIQLIKNWFETRFSDPQVVSLWILIVSGSVLVYFLGEMLMPVFTALVVAYLLDGLASFLQNRRIPRILSILLVFLIFFTAVVVLFVWMLPILSRQILELVQAIPSFLIAHQKELRLLPERYPEIISEALIQDITGFINSYLSKGAKEIVNWSLASFRSLVSVLIYLVLVPFMVFFFLKDKEKIMKWVTRYLPAERGLATSVWQEVNSQITNYIRGKILEVIIIWSISYVTFMLLGLEFTILLSLFVGLSVLIPYLGVAVMYLPILLVSYFQWGMSPHLAYAVLAYTIIQIFDGNLLAPLLLSEVVNLHPIAIIAAVLIFGGFWGFLGLFFAIPLATLVHAIMRTWEQHHTVK